MWHPGCVLSEPGGRYDRALYPARHRVHGHFADHKRNAERGMPNYLDPEGPTLTRFLQQDGYRVGHFGEMASGVVGKVHRSPTLMVSTNAGSMSEMDRNSPLAAMPDQAFEPTGAISLPK